MHMNKSFIQSQTGADQTLTIQLLFQTIDKFGYFWDNLFSPMF